MLKQFSSTLFSLGIIALLIGGCQSKVTLGENPTTVPTHTASPASSPIPATVPAPEPAWTCQTEGAIWSTPSLTAGVVYFGSDDGNLYALDAQTGRLKWKFLTQGMGRSRPAVAGDLIYFTSDDGYMYALAARTGVQTWQTDISNFMPADKRKIGGSSDPTGFDYKQSSPVVSDGKVYIGSLDGNIYALEAGTGKVDWTFTTGQKVRATPALAEGVLYIGSWDETMYALEALTGQLLWKKPVGGEVQSTALVADGTVYTGSRKASVVALDALTGETKWEYDYGKNMWVESSPVLVGNIVYIGSSGDKWVLGLDSQSGKADSFYFSEAFHLSTPTIADDVLYIGGLTYKTEVHRDTKSGLFALKLVDGKLSNPDDENPLFHVPEPEILENNWRGVAGSPIVQDGLIYFGGLDGTMYAVPTSSW